MPQCEQLRISKILDAAQPVDWESGLTAFECYSRVLGALADTWKQPFDRVVAAFCELSPASGYIQNLRSLVTLLFVRREGGSIDEAVTPTFKACRVRAWRRLDEGIEGFLAPSRNAPKITNFYYCITNPADPAPVVVDAHMYSVWRGERLTVREASEVKFDYDEVAADFRTVAARRSMRANQVQGVCWFTWKRIHGILYNPQMNLFVDPWQLRVQPSQLKPYSMGIRNTNWQGGRSRHEKGYIRIFAGADRGKLEHRVVIEKLDREGPCHLVRSLDDRMEVHHIDWNRAHNCPHNLLVLDEVIHDAFSIAHALRVRWGVHSKNQQAFGF